MGVGVSYERSTTVTYLEGLWGPGVHVSMGTFCIPAHARSKTTFQPLDASRCNQGIVEVLSAPLLRSKRKQGVSAAPFYGRAKCSPVRLIQNLKVRKIVYRYRDITLIEKRTLLGLYGSLCLRS